jgi:two-component system OmpR family sensor kinase
MIHRNSLKVQLSAVFLSFLSLLVFLGLLSIHELSDVNRVSVDIRDHWLQSTRILGDITNYTSDYRAAEANHLLAWNPELIASTEHEIVELDRAILVAQQSYEHVPQRESESFLYRRFCSEWREYKVVASQVFELSRASRKDAGSRLYMSSSRVAYSKASDTLGELTSRTVAGASDASGLAAETHEYARKLIIGAMALAIISMIGVLQYISRSISQPLLTLAARMRSLASNEMDIEIRGTQRRDEIGEMARAVVVFRNNAIELAHSQRGLVQQASMLEEKLQYEQRLTTLQRNFLAMASHEFRTPLTIIDGHAQRLIKMKAELQPHHIAERAEKIRSAVLRMTSVMDNLLTSSRLFDGDPSLYFHPVEIDIAKLLHDVCHLHREIWLGAQIYENFRQLPPTIMGDPHLLFQAFSNLLSNAVKYSPNGGLITVKAAVELDNVVVTTRDAGIGIPEQDRAQLFERYHRGSNVSGIAGTGIGLYLVKMVVSLHGGRVAVASEVGSGTEFTVRLPFKDDGEIGQTGTH